MYYDEKKGRYVINGEDESDDDVPPPPPPMAKAKVEEPVKQLEVVEKTGADSLMAPAFSGALSQRNRKPRPAINKVDA
jgi:hypothetical protein